MLSRLRAEILRQTPTRRALIEGLKDESWRRDFAHQLLQWTEELMGALEIPVSSWAPRRVTVELETRRGGPHLLANGGFGYRRSLGVITVCDTVITPDGKIEASLVEILSTLVHEATHCLQEAHDPKRDGPRFQPEQDYFGYWGMRIEVEARSTARMLEELLAPEIGQEFPALVAQLRKRDPSLSVEAMFISAKNKARKGVRRGEWHEAFPMWARREINRFVAQGRLRP